MNSNWNKVTFCLIASIYVAGLINCEDGNDDNGPKDGALSFFANRTIGETNEKQIDCGPNELCEKAQIQSVTCTRNLTSPIENKANTTDYICSSEPKLDDQKLKWTYSIRCLEEDKGVTNENCVIKITLKETVAPKVTPTPNRVPKNETFTFLTGKKVAFTSISQIECVPKKLCDKAQIKVVNCTGGITPIWNKTSTVDYTCTSDVKLEKLEWNYFIQTCSSERNNVTYYFFEICRVKITLKEIPNCGGSNIGLIIGIVVLLIAVLIGVMAFLGYKGVGPVKSFFKS